MPTVMVSHVVLDVPTLFAVTLFITVIGGLLLLFAFLQNRNTPALALWGIGYLIGAAGAALLSGQAAAVPNVWAVGAANALLCTAYGFMWCGARSFEGRRVSLDRAGDRPGAVDRRVPIRRLRPIAAGAHQSGCGDQRELCAARRARIVVRARPRSDLALADAGAGDRACGFSSGTHSLRAGLGRFGQ